MKFTRYIKSKLKERLGFQPVIMLFGARQVGKSTILKEFMLDFKNPLFLDCDNKLDKSRIENKNTDELLSVVGNHDLVVIDEAQVVDGIGTSLKLIADNIDKSKVQIIASGSSAFELGNKTNEPLTGRNTKLYMFPLTAGELIESYGNEHEFYRKLNLNLIYGNYPRVVSEIGSHEKELVLNDLTKDYLYKDLFAIANIKNTFAFERVVVQLALRLGNEISYDDIGKDCGLSGETVSHYVDLLEKAYIIFRLRPFYTNKIKEISKNHKIYFYDNGMRNAIIGNFQAIEDRADKGALFENFFISEKMKIKVYEEKKVELNFWRGGQTGEVDLVETTLHSGVHKAYEIKWKDASKLPTAFKNLYGDVPFEVVNFGNIVEKLK